MKVRFQYRGEVLYLADEKNWGDSYGDYYPAADVERLVDAAERALPWCESLEEYNILDEALAPFVEDK